MVSKKKDEESLRNFGLTEAEFNDLCDKLKAGDESLFETTFIKHFESAMNYLIITNDAMFDDAYDVVMNVFIEFRNRLLNDKIKHGNLKFLLTQMCVQRYKRKKRNKIDEAEFAYFSQHQEPPVDEAVYILLQKSIERMSEQCRQLIEDVYYSKIAYKVLAKKYKTTSAKLRKQKERCLTKLKMSLRQSLHKLK